MLKNGLRLFKICANDAWGQNITYFIPVHCEDDAVRFARDAGIDVQFVQEIFVFEGCIIE